MRATKYDLLGQRLEVDLKASRDPQDKSFYSVDFEIKKQIVTIGGVKKYTDVFDTRGEIIWQDENPILFNTLQSVLQVKFYG